MSRAIAWFWFDETQQVGQLEQIANLFKGTKVVVMDVPEDKELEEFAKVAGVDPSEVASAIGYESEFYRDEDEKRSILDRLRAKLPQARFI